MRMSKNFTIELLEKLGLQVHCVGTEVYVETSDADLHNDHVNYSDRHFYFRFGTGKEFVKAMDMLFIPNYVKASGYVTNADLFVLRTDMRRSFATLKKYCGEESDYVVYSLPVKEKRKPWRQVVEEFEQATGYHVYSYVGKNINGKSVRYYSVLDKRNHHIDICKSLEELRSIPTATYNWEVCSKL